MNPIRVMIADDHPLLIEGVAAVVGAQADMRLVGSAGDGREALVRFQTDCPDVVLMDVQMPRMDGIEATRQIRRLRPDARVLVLTTFHGDAHALAALAAGARGYLLKTMLRSDLLAAIREVAAGRRWIPAAVARALAEHVTDAALTGREVQVLDRVAEGRTNKRIGQELGISADTVKAHLKSILFKLRASDRTHAVTIALRRGFLQVRRDEEADMPAGAAPAIGGLRGGPQRVR